MSQGDEPDVCIAADIERVLFQRADQLSTLLKQLRQELSRVEMAVVSTIVGQPSERTPGPEACFRYHLAERRLRPKFLPASLTRGPPWLLLTNLYDAYLAQRRESIGSIGLLAELAPTTAIRWIDVLEAKGLVQLSPDPLDARRKWIELTPQGVEVLRTFFLTLSKLWASR